MARVLEISTPESVPIRLEMSPIALRAVAFSIDLMIISLILAGIILSALLFVSTLEGWGLAIVLVMWFLLRNFYFFFAETFGNGQTLGKKFTRIRVVDHSGQPLTTNALFLRNVTRDLELFLPMTAVFYPEALIPGAPWWLGLLSLDWLLVIAVIPFVHKENARVGDMIAGTVVVNVPRPVLGEDLLVAETKRRFVFTNEQLDMYGVYELQTLERVLRGNFDTYRQTAIAERITQKIGFSGQNWQNDSKGFLDEFYAALRGRLETRMMLGDRQDSKKEGKLAAKNAGPSAVSLDSPTPSDEPQL